MLNPCVVIPVYNHPNTIQKSVRRLRSMDLPVVLIDDGSDAACADQLNSLSAECPGVYLLRHPHNLGKGAAVCLGLQWAFARGYSHALQIDADGQHNLDDVPLFLKAAQQNPQQVISGNRIYINAPKSRMRARKITDVWVWINTLSTDIRDSMCGYRLYPLAETMPILKRHRIGKRMDFDTDILVKLVWSGIKVTHIPTQVIYADDIPSHFDLIKDNLRISWMHSRHFFGMLLRSPILIGRRLTSQSQIK